MTDRRTDGGTDGRTDRRTDKRTDGGDCNIPDAFLKKRGYNKKGTGIKVSKGAKIRNRYNQVPHLTLDTNGKVTNSQ